MMKRTTYEATVLDGRIVLPEGAQIPDNTRVFVIVPATHDAERVRMMSPRLVNPDDAHDFTMQVELERE